VTESPREGGDGDEETAVAEEAEQSGEQSDVDEAEPLGSPAISEMRREQWVRV